MRSDGQRRDELRQLTGHDLLTHRLRSWVVGWSLLLLFATACASGPSPSAAPTGGAPRASADEVAAPTATAALGSPAAIPSFEPIAREPLPSPELETADEIGAAIMAPPTRLQGVVSLLHQLGIGTYADDGDPIVPGAEADGAPLWLTESEVHAVAEMAAAEHPADFIDFRDWHAALVELGLHASAEELVAAYEEAYFTDAEPSFFVNALFANGLFLDPDGELTHLHAWLLFLDGFVVGTQGGAASVVLASFHQGRWGGASAVVPRFLGPGSPLTSLELTLLAMRLQTLARATPMWFEPPSLTAHEGHNRPGDEVSLTFRWIPFPPSEPALDMGFLLAANPRPAGLPVSFVASDPSVVEEHGAMRDPSGADPFTGGRRIDTDGGGTVRLTFAPIEEEADGEGELSVDRVVVTANVALRDIVLQTWVLPPVVDQLLIGDRSVQTWMELEWHEAEGLRIEMTDTYDVTIDLLLAVGRATGTDTFSGFLALQEDGTWRGTVQGRANGTWESETLGETCSTPVGGTQELLAIAEEFDTPTDEGGEIGIQLYPIAPPQITQLGCEFMLSRWEGDYFDDPDRPRGEGIPPQDYAPFNDLRVTDPVVTSGVPAPLPESGSETITWTEHLEGVGGGTWTVTVERVDSDD